MLVAALRAFSTDGPPATLEAVARDAGVGIGTLYRHFPSREALVEAVYRHELERLCAEPADLLEGQPADRALRAWMSRYADFVTTKRGMAEALREVIASGAVTSAQTRARLSGAIQTMLDAGKRDGSLRADVAAEDVCAALVGVVLAAGTPEQRQQADRILDLVTDGLRPRTVS